MLNWIKKLFKNKSEIIATGGKGNKVFMKIGK